jgi:hypothetical protein
MESVKVKELRKAVNVAPNSSYRDSSDAASAREV